MSDAAIHKAWTDANQRYLVAEFARLKLRLGADGDVQAAAGLLQEARAALTSPAAIDVLADMFGLSPFERDLLLLCAGVEMDAEVARRCADAQAHAQHSYASFALGLAALENPHWSALAPLGPLRRWRLIEVDDGAGFAAGRLRIDERILHYLAGVNYLDPRLQPLLRPMEAPPVMADGHRVTSASALEALRAQSAPPPVIELTGNDLDGQRDVAACIAAGLGLQLQRARMEELPAGAAESEAFAVLWQREAALLGAVLLVECRDGDVPKFIAPLAERLSGMVIVAGCEMPALNRPVLRFTVNKPDGVEQKHLWEQGLGPAVTRLNGTLDLVAAQFRLSARTILETARELRSAGGGSDKLDTLLWRACRSAGGSKLADLAQRIDAAASWNDLVLPAPQSAALRQIAAHARHRLKVYQDWGFAAKSGRGLGIAALFTGESGTGKTMAAEVLANELHLDLYRIDLSCVVSKYIGETEKNLRRVFDAAEDSGAILLFDEADALFGKRGEVRDSHDRYANIEVSYLLQRMEAYRGLAILTTNLKSNLDSAFQRRLRFVVHFPFPDLGQREAIWRGIFPPATPLEAVDCAKLARLNMSGGNIRNIALGAAFLAAQEGGPVRMAHLLQAAHSEAAKRERALAEAETRGWV